LLIGSRLFKTLCWIGWRLSQPSPKAVLHLLRSPSGQVRVGNPHRSRALAQSGCRSGSFFFFCGWEYSGIFVISYIVAQLFSAKITGWVECLERSFFIQEPIPEDRNFMRKNKANYAGKNRKIMRCDAVIIPWLCGHYAGSNSMYLRIFR